jgi:hypothetical protein
LLGFSSGGKDSRTAFTPTGPKNQKFQQFENFAQRQQKDNNSTNSVVNLCDDSSDDGSSGGSDDESSGESGVGGDLGGGAPGKISGQYCCHPNLNLSPRSTCSSPGSLDNFELNSREKNDLQEKIKLLLQADSIE